MRRPTRFERDLRDLHGPEVVETSSERPRHYSPVDAPKVYSWPIRVMAGAAILPLLAIIALLTIAAVVFGWVTLYALGSLFGLIR